MQIILGPGCDRAWREGLTPWQEENLAALYRQGRGLPDKTNHGSDMRWAQAGVRTRDSHGNWRRNASGHERVVIQATDFGYTALFIRRAKNFAVDPNTGEMPPAENVWKIVDIWHVGKVMSANHPHPDLGKHPNQKEQPCQQ